MSAIRHLLAEIIDYAGLFPPAGLPLDSVVRNYNQYLRSHERWMLARLIVPATRLAEFHDCHKRLFSEQQNSTGVDKWKLSALIPAFDAPDRAFETALDSIQQFNSSCQFAIVDTVEGKLPNVGLIRQTCDALNFHSGAALHAFLEIPWQGRNGTEQTIAELADIGRANTFGKIRTGGVTPDLIPSTRDVARFVSACAQSGLGFKATAGLHHPVRSEFALTYDADSPRSTMHGFMNVFLAACFASLENWPVDQLTDLLDSESADEFMVETDSISFRGDSLSTEQIGSVRQELAVSFGSCSFTEPVQDLVDLGWLASEAKSV